MAKMARRAPPRWWRPFPHTAPQHEPSGGLSGIVKALAKQLRDRKEPGGRENSLGAAVFRAMRLMGTQPCEWWWPHGRLPHDAARKALKKARMPFRKNMQRRRMRRKAAGKQEVTRR